MLMTQSPLRKHVRKSTNRNYGNLSIEWNEQNYALPIHFMVSIQNADKGFVIQVSLRETCCRVALLTTNIIC